MRAAVVIPAYNEATALRDVATRALAQCAWVCVVDDGSTDATAASVEDLPLILIRHPFNQGKAASLWDGFVAAAAADADVVITLDGDGQHRPEDIPRLVAASQQHPHRLVIGARLRGRAHAPLTRRIANAVADFWLSWAAGHRVADSQSGQRAYPAPLLRHLLGAPALRHDAQASFVLESEILIVAARQGYETVAVPIDTVYFAPRASHFRPVRDIARIARMVAGHLLATRMNPRGLWRCLFQRPSILSASATATAVAPETPIGDAHG